MNPSPRPLSGSGIAARANRRQRSDGVEARAQLLQTALRLFSEKGFAKTSTREIAQAAGANIAAISYYFGDKAGLYRAAFTEPMGCVSDDLAIFNRTDMSLHQSLQGFFQGFLEPLKQGELVQLCTRLQFREMLEPTGLWADEIHNGIKPAHTALVDVLCRHLALKTPDDDVHRLAFSIAGLAVQMFICRDIVDVIRPQLLNQPAAVDAWSLRLLDYAEAMVASEAARRSATPDSTPKSREPHSRKARA